MKCASSTICAYFEDHPDSFMVPGCEPDFFSKDENYAKGTDWYEEHFMARAREKVCAEGSNSYSSGALFPNSAKRLAAYNPNIKVVYMVRDPIDRIKSDWVQRRADSGDDVPPTVNQAVRMMPDVFIDSSMYWRNLQIYRSVFPDDQIFVGFMEDLKADSDAFFRSLCQFLELPFNPVSREHQNSSSGKFVPNKYYSKLKKLPFLPIVKQLVPASIRQSVKKKFLSDKVNSLPSLSPSEREVVLELVRPDAHAFLSHCGKPSSFWRL